MFLQAISTLSAALVLALACGYAGGAVVSGDLAQQTYRAVTAHQTQFPVATSNFPAAVTGERPAGSVFHAAKRFSGLVLVDAGIGSMREVVVRNAAGVDARSATDGTPQRPLDAANGGTILLDTQFHDPASGDKAPVCACLIPVDKIRFRGGPHGETRPRHPRLGALG